MVDYEAVLLDLVDKYLADDLDFMDFSKVFATYYYEVVPDIDEYKWNQDFFRSIIERWEYTSQDPTDEELRDGIISAEAFKSWLREHRGTHKRGAQ